MAMSGAMSGSMTGHDRCSLAMTGAQLLIPDLKITLVYFLNYYAVSVTKGLIGFLKRTLN